MKWVLVFAELKGKTNICKGKKMIKKLKGKYVVLSETTGRKFGTYATLDEAKKRLKQIEFFKHAKREK